LLGFELFANELLHVDSKNESILLGGLEEFREHLGGELTITLLQGIGKGFEVHEVDSAQMLLATRELEQRQREKALAQADASA
jgi:3-dehydroquinate synthase